MPRKKFVMPIVNDLVENKISAKQLYDKLAPITSLGLPLNEEQALYQGTLKRLGVSKQNAKLIRTPGFADQLGTKLTGILVSDLHAVYQAKHLQDVQALDRFIRCGRNRSRQWAVGSLGRVP